MRPHHAMRERMLCNSSLQPTSLIEMRLRHYVVRGTFLIDEKIGPRNESTAPSRAENKQAAIEAAGETVLSSAASAFPYGSPWGESGRKELQVSHEAFM